jgi:hypothetical protein
MPKGASGVRAHPASCLGLLAFASRAPANEPNLLSPVMQVKKNFDNLLKKKS